MNRQTSMLHIRVDDELKAEATKTLGTFGLSVSEAVRMFLTGVARDGGLPVGLTTDPEAYDAWFRARVREAMADDRPEIGHGDVMDEVQSVIDRSRGS